MYFDDMFRTMPIYSVYKVIRKLYPFVPAMAVLKQIRAWYNAGLYQFELPNTDIYTFEVTEYLERII